MAKPINLPPAPTYANPVIVDQYAQDGRFHPAWLDWFLRLRQGFNSGQGGCNTSTIIDGSTSRTSTIDDECQIIEFTNSSAITVTIPTSAASGLAKDSSLYFLQAGTGQVTVQGDVGVTLDTSDTNKTRTQWSLIGYKCIDVDIWEAIGDLEPYVIGNSALIRAAATAGAPSFVASVADHEVLKRTGTGPTGVVGWGLLTAADIAAGGVLIAQASTAIVDFGAFPGTSDTSVAVTGLTNILASSVVNAWITPIATADHSADEHRVETINVMAGNIVAATGFTIYALNSSQVYTPNDSAPKLYGQWTVAWQYI